jgi:hypothetical protein
MVEISLRGLDEVASDILSGTFEEISDVYAEEIPTEWDLYDTFTPA